MHWTEDCICNRNMINSKLIEFDLSNSRVELRCRSCNGLVGWWDVPSGVKKIMPFKRMWSEEECLAMR
jgi:hypothetical protein